MKAFEHGRADYLTIERQGRQMAGARLIARISVGRTRRTLALGMASLACVAIGASSSATAEMIAQVGAEHPPWTPLVAALVDASGFVHELLRHGLVRQPAAMLAMAVGACVPVLAVVAALARWRRQALARRVATLEAEAASASLARAKPQPPRTAWLEHGAGREPVLIGELTRIGTGTDCDLALSGDGKLHDETVEALIERTPDREFYILDVATAPGSRLSVNGERQRYRRLADGDQIEIRGEQLVFRLAETTRSLTQKPMA